MLEAAILGFLVPDVFADHGLIAAERGHEVSTRPDVLTEKVALALAVDPRDVDRALSLDVANDLRNRVFWRYRDEHVNMIGIRWPSSIRDSLGRANAWNTSPRWRLRLPYSVRRRHFGMNTT